MILLLAYLTKKLDEKYGDNQGCAEIFFSTTTTCSNLYLVASCNRFLKICTTGPFEKENNVKI